MTRRLPLFEFMPYGAPELLEQSRPGMARALVLGSVTWLALFASLMSLGPWNPSPIVIDFTPTPPGHQSLKPPSIEPPATPRVHSVVPAPPPDIAKVVPVLDPPVTEPVLPFVPATDGTEIGAIEGKGGPPEPGTAEKWITFEALPAEPILSKDADHEPVMISARKPQYPDLAREAGVEGDVVVRLLVGFDGRVDEVKVMNGVPMLNEAATSAAKHWVFTAPMSKGKPVRVWVDVPVRFRLHTN